jgi:hypothetical protein
MRILSMQESKRSQHYREPHFRFCSKFRNDSRATCLNWAMEVSENGHCKLEDSRKMVKGMGWRMDLVASEILSLQ